MYINICTLQYYLNLKVGGSLKELDLSCTNIKLSGKLPVPTTSSSQAVNYTSWIIAMLLSSCLVLNFSSWISAVAK